MTDLPRIVLEVRAFARWCGDQFRDVRAKLDSIGDLAALSTTDKATLVAAINEVNAKPSGGSGGPGGAPQFVTEVTTSPWAYVEDDPSTYMPIDFITVEHGLGTEAVAVTVTDAAGIVVVPVWRADGPDTVTLAFPQIDFFGESDPDTGMPPALPVETFVVRVDGSNEPYTRITRTEPGEGWMYGDLRAVFPALGLSPSSMVSNGAIGRAVRNTAQKWELESLAGRFDALTAGLPGQIDAAVDAALAQSSSRWSQTIVVTRDVREQGRGEIGQLGVAATAVGTIDKLSWRVDTPGETDQYVEVKHVMWLGPPDSRWGNSSFVLWVLPGQAYVPVYSEFTIPAGQVQGEITMPEGGSRGFLGEGVVFSVLIGHATGAGQGLAITLSGVTG